jgi:bacillithiol biosynthesis deacetylase BshB1
LGARFRETLQLEDGFFRYDKPAMLEIIRIIRKYQPDIVLANALDDRHPDHGRAAKLTADACFYAGLVKIPTLDNGVEQQRWRPKAVYHYIQDRNLTPDFVVDISPYMEQKITVVSAFSSQFHVPEAAAEFNHELSTPISGVDFMAFLYAKARAYGRDAGLEFAEGFNVNRTPGLSNLFDLI